MPTIRVRKDDKYFTASNEPFNDRRLSWESRGLMGYLLTKPNNWEIRQKDLEQQGPAGEHKLRRMLAELRQYGYMNRIRIALQDGKFDWTTEVFESPSQNPKPNAKVTTRRFSTSGSPTSGKPPDVLNTDSPSTENEEEEAELGFAAAWKFFQNNICPAPAPYDAELFGDLVDEHSPKWVIEAMKIAVGRNARTINFFKAILTRWKVNGYGSAYPNGNGKGKGKANGKSKKSAPNYDDGFMEEYEARRKRVLEEREREKRAAELPA
jgi:DnaD/phage-associated family protein